MDFNQLDYHSIKQKKLKGRYITYDHISGILSNLGTIFKVDKLGESVHGLPIESVTFGQGPIKIFMWSQMHGNESTTTKAVFDVLNWVVGKSIISETILNNCTVKVIPILNPDGAKAYTRVNANNVDLNRDAQERSQPESKVLRSCYEAFKPNFCFNLHDQRTIFNVGKTSKPATVSFLAPAHDEARTISQSREQSMQLISCMNKVLQKTIPGQVGRYDDTFNANCIGDTFQMLNTPTILFEAGHYPGDYERESTREYIFLALITALEVISKNSIPHCDHRDYFKIPGNNKFFYDILIKNAHCVNSDAYAEHEAIGILFKETLKKERIIFEPKIEKRGDLQGCYGHETLDCLLERDLEDLKKSPIWDIL